MHWTRCNRCLVVTLFAVLPMASAQAERTTILYTVHADGTYSPVASYLVDPEVAAAAYAKSTAAQQEGGARLYGNVGSDEAVHIGSAEGFAAFLAANYPSLGDVATNEACDSFGQIKFDLSCPFNCLPDPFECIAQVGVKATVTCLNEPPCPTGVCLGGANDGLQCTVAADCAGGVCDASSAKSQCVDHPERIMTISIQCPKGVNSACDCRPNPELCELQPGCVVGSFSALGHICECEVPPPPENFCIYTVECVDGSCANCPFRNPGAKCFAFECIDTCTVGFTSTCGGAAGDCCLEMTWQGLCEDPAGLPPCPLEEPCTCDPTPGACCDDANTCVVTIESKCTGKYFGDGTVCLGIEACCLPDNTCVEIDRACCQKKGGAPQGVGSFCEPVEPCCLPTTNDTGDTGKDCVLMEPKCCEKKGGVPKACTLGAPCCTSDFQCGKCETCDLVTNTCVKNVPNCCTSDAQCPGKCDVCDLLFNVCVKGIPGCCETDTQCPGTKCRAGICLTTNTCTLGPKAPGCCETDTQCPSTKCRLGLCDLGSNTCTLGPKAPGCCEGDAQCPSTKCRQGFCVLSTNTCDLSDKLPGCCETDTQCPGTKCRIGFCDFDTNTCDFGPKVPNCCEGDAQCPSTKCRQGFCVLSTNTCDLSDKDPPDCCETDAQCDVKCEVCDLATNKCFIPTDSNCCSSDAQCPEKCESCNLQSNKCFKRADCCSSDAQCPGTKCRLGFCDFLSNTCRLSDKFPGCCEGDAQCGKCETCNLTNNTCVKNVPNCCTGDAQCGKCETCNLTNNTCVKNVPNCCTGDAQCGKCQTCDLVNNVCVKNVPGCCTGNAQCGKCQTCDLVNNVCVKTVPNCCTGNAQCGPGEVCDLASNKCVGDLFTKWSQRPVVCECKGDVDKDGSVTLTDVVIVIDCSANGNCALCANSCDVNCDGVIDQADVNTTLCGFNGDPPEVCCNVAGGEDVPSNLDWPDFAPNVVVADDWVSDGRVITAVRWWGSRLKEVDPKACPGPEGAVCGDPDLQCVCAVRPDGSLNCADSKSLADCVNFCATDGDCVAPSKCFGITGARGFGCCAVNCGETPPDPKLCEGKGTPCGDPGQECVCETRLTAVAGAELNCADATDFFSVPPIHGFCFNGDIDCPIGTKCFRNREDGPVCAHNCGEHPPDPKACDNPWVCGQVIPACGADPNCVCATRPDGTGNCVFDQILGDCPNRVDSDCPAGTKCVIDTCAGDVCAANCDNVSASGLTPRSGRAAQFTQRREVQKSDTNSTSRNSLLGGSTVESSPRTEVTVVPTNTPQFAVGDPDGWFLSFHQPLSQGGDTQRSALAVYFCDIDVVRQTPTTLPACDGHPVIEYFVQLEDCCLVHENPDTRYDPPLPVAFKDGFHEQQCDDYHLDVQAVVGVKFFQDPNTLECIEFKTNRSADTDFWGWHTTDKVCGKQKFGPFPALIGSVKMGAAIDWFYGPWSKFTPVCSPPNMAFELLTPEPDDGVGDINGNCVPDKCECPPINPPKLPAAASHAAQRKIRYFSIVPNNPGKLTALRVTLTSSLTFPSAVGKQWWVGQPQEVCENPGQGLATPPAMCGSAAGIPKRTMWSSDLNCAQICLDWHSLVDVAGNALDVLHVGDRDIAPDSVYEIQAVDCTCDKTNPGNFSLPLAIGTSRWGDVSRVLPSDCPRQEPEGSVGLIMDCVAILNKFSGDFCAVLKSRADIEPHVPDRVINISDVLKCLNAFSGLPYPFPGPVGCP